MVAPAAGAYEPGRHRMHDERDATGEYEPAGHCIDGDAPGQYDPAAHATHCEAEQEPAGDAVEGGHAKAVELGDPAGQ